MNLDEIISSATEHPFDMIQREKSEFTFFFPKGRLNNATRKFFKNPLYDAANEYDNKIIVNLKYVDSIDSVGLGIIISAHKMVSERGGMMFLTNMNERILKTMKILHMDRYLNITSNMKSALEMMS